MLSRASALRDAGRQQRPAGSKELPREEIFSRSLAFWGDERQRMLAETAILVGGMGALGCVVSEILVRSGVGRLYLVDRGLVDPPDLNRQALYTQDDLGQAKAAVAARRLEAMTGCTELVPLEVSVGEHDLAEVIEECRGLADCLDNYAGRFALEDALRPGMFMVSGALLGDYGQATTIVPGATLALRDLYKGLRQKEGVVPVTPAVVFCLGSIMAQEILLNLAGRPELVNQLLVAGLAGLHFSRLKLNPA